jgi:streptogramin lyase
MERVQQVTWRDPLGTEPVSEPWRTDLVLPSFFLAAATLILAYINPAYLGFKARPVETYVAVILSIAIVMWGLYKERAAYVLVGSGLLLLLVALCLSTQPSQLGISSSSVWPLRVSLFLLVASSWAFLTRPPIWARRALVALAVPTVLVVICAGGPALRAAVANMVTPNGANGFVPPPPAYNFSPYWLAVDSQGTLYASAASGGFIQVFDASGVPLGTIRPAIAPDAGEAGMGILPVSFPTPTPIPTPGIGGVRPTFAPPMPFCGLAIDPNDNLYIVDPYNNQILRFGKDGKITRRLPLPEKFAGARGCLATDAEHIFVSSGFGSVFIMDYEGHIEKEVKLDYQPFGVAPDGKGDLLVLGPNELSRINIATGAKEVAPPPPRANDNRVRYQTIIVSKEGDILGVDLANSRVVRIDPQSGDLLGSIGTPGSLQGGYWPGQFQSLGGIAQDNQGRIYVADWQLGVIQRFTPQGDLEAMIWAPGEVPQVPVDIENE